MPEASRSVGLLRLTRLRHSEAPSLPEVLAKRG
jgi:hypothetical protein